MLTAHEALAQLLDNEWLSLTVVDPTEDNRAFRYDGGLEWTPAFEPAAARVETPDPAVADD
ncbi:hypothetical protein ACFQRB_17230 [Halobaculum litoreum]|uniref:Uncharacterized protein n=1 Tax=Halobaculum litoreum TaxID=3031998 RepID=A0ABD5XWY6_9EURY